MSNPTKIAHRYFFALRPDAIAARRIHAFAERRLGSDGLLAAERLHVTLAITPDFSVHHSALAEAMVRAGQRVLAAPFDLLLDRLSIGARSVALRPGHKLPGLYSLQERIARAMAAEGVAMRPDWRFNPHVTLCYRHSPPGTQPVSDRGWDVNEFALVHSLVGQTRHELLGRWRLDRSADAQLALFPA